MSCVFLADIGNLYYFINQKYERHLDYKKLLDKANKICQVDRMVAYGTQKTNEAAFFIGCLRDFGYQVKYKNHTVDDTNTIIRKATWDVGIVLDIVRFSEKYQTIILGTTNTNIIPALHYAKERGTTIITLACNINNDIWNCSDFNYEITEDLLQVKEENATPATSE